MTGFMRKALPDAQKIQARVTKAAQEQVSVDVNVAPLAQGFFALERMRAGRAAGRPRLKGTR